MHKKNKRDIKFLIAFVLITLGLVYLDQLGFYYPGAIMLFFIPSSIIFMIILFFDTGISVIGEESEGNNLKNDDCFYVKSETLTENSKMQKAEKNSTGKTILKYIFYTILAVVIAIVVIIALFVSILSQIPPGTDM